MTDTESAFLLVLIAVFGFLIIMAFVREYLDERIKELDKNIETEKLKNKILMLELDLKNLKNRRNG